MFVVCKYHSRSGRLNSGERWVLLARAVLHCFDALKKAPWCCSIPACRLPICSPHNSTPPSLTPPIHKHQHQPCRNPTPHTPSTASSRCSAPPKRAPASSAPSSPMASTMASTMRPSSASRAHGKSRMRRCCAPGCCTCGCAACAERRMWSGDSCGRWRSEASYSSSPGLRSISTAPQRRCCRCVVLVVAPHWFWGSCDWGQASMEQRVPSRESSCMLCFAPAPLSSLLSLYSQSLITKGSTSSFTPNVTALLRSGQRLSFTYTPPFVAANVPSSIRLQLPGTFSVTDDISVSLHGWPQYMMLSLGDCTATPDATAAWMPSATPPQQQQQAGSVQQQSGSQEQQQQQPDGQQQQLNSQRRQNQPPVIIISKNIYNQDFNFVAALVAASLEYHTALGVTRWCALFGQWVGRLTSLRSRECSSSWADGCACCGRADEAEHAPRQAKPTDLTHPLDAPRELYVTKAQAATMLRNAELRRLARAGRVGFVTVNGLAHYHKWAILVGPAKIRLASNGPVFASSIYFDARVHSRHLPTPLTRNHASLHRNQQPKVAWLYFNTPHPHPHPHLSPQPPTHTRLLYAYQCIVYTHASLAHWGEDVRLLFADFDECVAIPAAGQRLQQLLARAGWPAVAYLTTHPVFNSALNANRSESEAWRAVAGKLGGVWGGGRGAGGVGGGDGAAAAAAAALEVQSEMLQLLGSYRLRAGPSAVNPNALGRVKALVDPNLVDQVRGVLSSFLWGDASWVGGEKVLCWFKATVALLRSFHPKITHTQPPLPALLPRRCSSTQRTQSSARMGLRFTYPWRRGS